MQTRPTKSSTSAVTRRPFPEIAKLTRTQRRRPPDAELPPRQSRRTSNALLRQAHEVIISCINIARQHNQQHCRSPLHAYIQ